MSRGTHGGGAKHGIWEPGKSAGRRCLPAPSAGTGLAALPAFRTAHAPSSCPVNPGFPGEPSCTRGCPSGRCKARGRAGPTVAAVSEGSAVQPQGRAERSLLLPTLGTHSHSMRVPAAPQRRGGEAGPPPGPLQGHAELGPPCPPTCPGPRCGVSQWLASELGTKGKEKGRKKEKKKKRKGPVSQLWPFMPRAFGPSSKGIGFAEANDDTSTSSGAGSACCWRRATRVKKYCGHLIIDSLFLHYGRAQRPQLRLRPLHTHTTHARTGQAPESLAKDGQHHQSQYHGPSWSGWHHSKLPAQPQMPIPMMLQGCILHFPTPLLHQRITTSHGETAP